MKHQRALGARSKVSVHSRLNWNLEMLVFVEGGKLENPEKTLGAGTRTNNKLNPHMTLSLGNYLTQATLVGGKYSHHYAITAPKDYKDLWSHSLGNLKCVHCI